MPTALLTAVFIWCLFFGKMPAPVLAGLCAAAAVLLARAGRHRHGKALPIDVSAQVSRLKNVGPAFKIWNVLVLIFVCLISRSPWTGVFLLCAMCAIAVRAGGMKLRHYVHNLALPVSFLMIGGLALLFEIAPAPLGVINIPAFGSWLSVSAGSQTRTALVVARAMGAVSCLCFLSVTTPMPDIIGTLRRARCPELIVDLMYLIYRYIFILLSLHHEMRDAAKSRLGFRDYRTGMRATGRIYANLLARSYQFAGKNFDAMESRCYDGGIRFLERPRAVAAKHVIVSAALLVVSALPGLLLR